MPTILSTSAYAACVFTPGPAASAGDDTVDCDNSGSDPAGVSTLAGNDTVTIDNGSAINGLLHLGEGNSVVTNAGLIDSSTAAVEVLGNSIFNNTALGVINFADAGSDSGVDFYGQNSTSANLNIDNRGLIIADDGSDSRGGIRVTGYTTGVVDIHNHAGAVLSAGQPGGSTLVGSGHEVGGVIVEFVEDSTVTVVNDGTVNVSTNTTYAFPGSNTYGLVGIDLPGSTYTNNGAINVAASNEETNAFGIIAIGSTDSAITNTGSMSVNASASYVGFPADESAEIGGIVSLAGQGSQTIENALAATIDIVGDATGTGISFVGMAQVACVGGSGCLASSIVNAGAISVTVNDGAGAVGAGMFAVEGFVNQVINNSGAMTVVNNAPAADIILGLNASSLTAPTIVNSGTVSIQNVADSGASLGALINDTANPYFNNQPTGSIAVTGSASFGVVMIQSGSSLSLGVPNLSNEGTLSAAAGIIINGSPAVNGNINHYIANSGTLTGTGGTAIDSVVNLGFSAEAPGATVETIDNSGTINGDINLGLGDDRVIQTAGTSAINGNVNTGGGDDIFEWIAGAVTSFSAGEGSDAVFVDALDYDGTQVLDGGDDTASGDGWVDTLTLRELSTQITGSNLTNWEIIHVAGSALTSTDNQLSVGADPGTGLMFSDGGLLDLQNGAPTDAFTLTGNFNGGGELSFDSALGDSSSASDTLTIMNAASGVTTVSINNVGGVGSVTSGDGILLIDVRGSSSPGAFQLDGGGARAGNYVYQLVQVEGQNWYLQSTFDPVSPPIDPRSPVVAVPAMNKYALIVLALLVVLVSGRSRLVRYG